jgi:hypothetical protein
MLLVFLFILIIIIHIFIHKKNIEKFVLLQRGIITDDRKFGKRKKSKISIKKNDTIKQKLKKRRFNYQQLPVVDEPPPIVFDPPQEQSVVTNQQQQQNIVDQPPAPQSNTTVQTLSSITFSWNNFKQIKIGLLNVYAPYISSLHVNLYSNTTDIQVGPANLFSTFTFSSDYIPYGKSNFEAIEFNNSNSAFLSYYNSTQIPDKKTLAIGIDSTRFSTANEPFAVSVHFRNFSSNTPNIL